MAKPANGANALSVPFYCIRNITSPEDAEYDRKVFAGQMPIEAVLNLPTNENVREYLLDAHGLKRKVPTQVHRAIKDTLANHGQHFSVLNGGVVIVASDSEVNESQRKLTIKNASIVNGSQTQGVIRDFLDEYEYDSDDPIHVKFELIIARDSDLIAEISIARNFQNDVKPLSIAGARGYFDDLQASITKAFPGMRLSTSETERPSDEVLDTEKLLKIITALTPAELWTKSGEMNKAYTYDRTRTCLKEFEDIYKRAKEPKDDVEKKQYGEIYKYYLDIAPTAWNLYTKWKQHQGFKGTGLRSIRRSGKQIVEVPDGIIWPILAAHCEFISKTGSKWKLVIPKQFDESRLITAAKSNYVDVAKSKPEGMGKMKACYSNLQNITSIYRDFAELAG